VSGATGTQPCAVFSLLRASFAQNLEVYDKFVRALQRILDGPIRVGQVRALRRKSDKASGCG